MSADEKRALNDALKHGEAARLAVEAAIDVAEPWASDVAVDEADAVFEALLRLRKVLGRSVTSAKKVTP